MRSRLHTSFSCGAQYGVEDALPPAALGLGVQLFFCDEPAAQSLLDGHCGLLGLKFSQNVDDRASRSGRWESLAPHHGGILIVRPGVKRDAGRLTEPPCAPGHKQVDAVRDAVADLQESERA